MSEQLEFDPAMFGMKANHGMLRAKKNSTPSTGANSQMVGSSGAAAGGQSQSTFEEGSQQQQQSSRGRGGRGRGGGGGQGQRGGGGFNNRGRGSNRGGARGGHDGQPFKRQRFDNDGPNRGLRGFFKPSMLDDPWQHLS